VPLENGSIATASASHSARFRFLAGEKLRQRGDTVDALADHENLDISHLRGADTAVPSSDPVVKSHRCIGEGEGANELVGLQNGLAR